MVERGNILFVAMIAMLIGVSFSSMAFSGIEYPVVVLGVAIVAIIFGAITKKRAYVVCAFICVAFALGGIRFSFWLNNASDIVLEHAVGKNESFSGVIINEPDRRENSTRLVVQIEEGGEESPWESGANSVLLVTDRFPEYRYGDRIEFSGILEYPRSIAGDDGRVFDYPMYLRSKGVSYEMFRPQIVRRSEGGGVWFLHFLLLVKYKFVESLSLVLPEPENGLAGGILLGERRSLGAEWTERFRTAGIIHIVVLSGYNMTIVAEWLGKIFRFLGFKGSILASSLGIMSFALLAGSGATVVRAAIMALVVLFARLTGRTAAAGRGLLLAASVMVIWNPSILAYDPSFQLSFLASLGLIYCSPLVERVIPKNGRFRVFRETLITTIATQLFVLPLLIHSTGTLSLISLAANLVVLPIVPAAMLSAFFAGLLNFLGPIVAFLPGLAAHFALGYILLVAKIAAALPYAAVPVPPMGGWAVAAAYITLGLLVYYFGLRSHRGGVSAPGEKDNGRKEKPQ